ncbi:MAG: ComEA family DNA-binding protein [Acholeplasmataceae bacterium]
MKRYIIPIGIIIFIINSTIIYILRPKSNTYHYSSPQIITVEIYGEIYFPGKYQILENSTLDDLINYAQGVKPTADVSSINLNEVLQPNFTYHIPSTIHDDERKIKYNLNEITYQELLTLDGITENRALHIIMHREKIGKFNSIEELLDVKYIGEVTYNKIKDYFFIR